MATNNARTHYEAMAREAAGEKVDVLARNRYRIPRWLAARLAGRVAPSCNDGNCRI